MNRWIDVSMQFLVSKTVEMHQNPTKPLVKCKYECMNAWMHECMNAWMHECMNAWLSGYMTA